MSSRYLFSALALHALLFCVLFHKQSIAINLFLYELLFGIYLLWKKEFPIKTTVSRIVSACLGITAIGLILVGSQWIVVINLYVLLVFIGIVIYPSARSVLTAIGLSAHNLVASQFRLTEIKSFPAGRLFRNLRHWYIFLIPLVIIVLFLLMYSGANEDFAQVISNSFDHIYNFFERLFWRFDISIVVTILIGIIAGNILLLRSIREKLATRDREANDQISRSRPARQRVFSFFGLKREFKAAIFLLFTLNLFLLLLNVLDVQHIWLRKDWAGMNHTQNVHEGIYLLILSIFISIGIVLYYFRNNLNFYSKNKVLVFLAYVWILQNAFLAVSAGVRNFRYIEYCDLAYKRIGVFIFLLAVIAGLITVLIKVYKKKSSFYLFRANSLSITVILVASSLVNWDSVIARYNLASTNTEDMDHRFLLGLSDKALPYLSLPATDSKRLFDDKGHSWDRNYISPEMYNQQLLLRKQRFVKRWEAKTILEWDYPDHSAYVKIREELAQAGQLPQEDKTNSEEEARE